MKKLIILLILSCTTFTFYGQDKVTLTDAKIAFTFVSKKVNGTISGFNSSSTIDKSDITNSKISGAVQSKTLDSGNFLRNWSLKGSKYFDTDTYPSIGFEASSIEKATSGFKVTGPLTIKDISKNITIHFKEEGNRLIGTTTLYSSDFGIEIMKKSRDENKVTVKMSFKMN